MYKIPTFVLVLRPISISSTYNSHDFILLLIRPKLVLKFSEKLSFGPLNDNSLSIVAIPLSRSALNSKAYICLVITIKNLCLSKIKSLLYQLFLLNNQLYYFLGLLIAFWLKIVVFYDLIIDISFTC